MSMNQERLEALFQRFETKNPNPTTELVFTTPFELLVAVMLSAQATDVGVNRATAALFPVANTPEKILALGIDRLKIHLQRLNLYPTKAKHLMATCVQLIDRHAGEVPADRTALEALPGVGPKTASVILNTVFHQPTIPVDTHVLRVACRLGLATGKTPSAVQAALQKDIPTVFQKKAHHWLVLHGRYICRARKPLCATCFVADLCPYPDKILS